MLTIPRILVPEEKKIITSLKELTKTPQPVVVGCGVSAVLQYGVRCLMFTFTTRFARRPSAEDIHEVDFLYLFDVTFSAGFVKNLECTDGNPSGWATGRILQSPLPSPNLVGFQPFKFVPTDGKFINLATGKELKRADVVFIQGRKNAHKSSALVLENWKH